ncbi:long-chain-alcohol oxidase FAO4A-like [Salvia splendens]|uniref:long-chain-alcohol oxidase FAO4A-like n=1 Tax=Salvia splendens TaxID=180675 RepID=UPI001C26B427|nr:long-chain-alcohol oxidase FAO4A-like [Salvia splendens]
MAKRVEKKKSPFSAGQMEALTALCDTFLPSIPLDDIHDDSVTQFFQTSATLSSTHQNVAVLMGEKIKHPKVYLCKIALWLLSTWIGTFILCGRKSLSPHFPYFKRFSLLSCENRESIVLSWSQSNLFLLRLLYTASKIFILLLFFSQVNEKEENVSWKAIGYSRPDFAATEHEKGNDERERSKLEPPLSRGVVDLGRSKEAAVHTLRKSGFVVSSMSPSLVIRCDVVVVGSGAGGGVVAGVLAKAGYKVLVLEKGNYVPRNEFSLLEGEAMDEMYLSHGVLATENMDVLILAGSTVGGGTTINWSAAIRTPLHVRKEWSENHGLELFSSKVYERALDVVSERIGVQSEFDEEGFNNMVLRKGCNNLGYNVETIPRNSAPDHNCGSCCLGCRDGKKKGVNETWLVDLIESGNGAVLPGCEATRVVIGIGRASGVAFKFGSGETAVVEARATVVACGAICTPPLLKRSGLRNPSIGRNLHLHPVVMGWGYFPEAASWPPSAKRSHKGAIMTAMTKFVIADYDGMAGPGPGYEVLIQTPALHPGMFSALTPWRSGEDIKARLVKFSRTVHIFALARDRGSGEVKSPDHIRYEMEGGDEENLRRGLGRVLRILVAAGAEEVGTQNRRGRVLRAAEAGGEEVERFVEEESGRALGRLESPVCSAHQMGSCRMGVDPRVSAVGPTGMTWEVEALYVADSSVFPTALGVNPMLTVQAIAYCTAQSILQALA